MVNGGLKRTRSWWRRALPILGLIAGLVGAAVVVVVSALVPDDAPGWWVGLAAVCGVLAAFVLELVLVYLYARNQERKRDATVAEGLAAKPPRGDLSTRVSVAGLLHARRQDPIVAFQGRDALISQLVAWCAPAVDPGAVWSDRFRLVTGPGGAGKTRLADELVRRLDPSWHGMFLGYGTEIGAVATLRAAHEDRHLLIVVDYAENRSAMADDGRSVLEHLLTDVMDDPGEVRVLLLARDAGEWWNRLTRIAGDLGEVLATEATYNGTDLGSPEVDRQEFLDGAAAAYAEHLGAPVVPLVDLKAAEGESRVLDLTAAALVAVLNVIGDPHRAARVQQITPATVFDELLRHEDQKYWSPAARARGIDRDLITPMRDAVVAAAALFGVPDKEATLTLIGRVKATFPDEAAPPGTAVIAAWLRDLYPPRETGGWIEPLGPDRLAEHLAVRVLAEMTARSGENTVTDFLQHLDVDQATQAMTVLSRAATDPSRDDFEPARAWALSLIDGLPPDLNTRTAVYRAIPDQSVRMAMVAADAANSCAEVLTDDHDKEAKAAVYGRLALALRHAGKPDQALSSSQRAVDLYEALAEASPERYSPALAAAVSDLGAMLFELGRFDQAVPVIRRSAEIREVLARANPDRYGHAFAMSLQNLGSGYSEIGLHDRALPVMQQAVDLFEALAEVSPEQYNADFATSLSNLGNRYSDMGRPDKALPPTRRAVEIREHLAQLNPDRYIPDLATALVYLGNRYSELGRYREALKVTQRAVDLYEVLVGISPDRYAPELASSLTSVGNRYSELGRFEQALSASRRVVEFLEGRALVSPDRYTPDLAMSLINLGNNYQALGRYREALKATQRALDLYETLASASPHRYNPELAIALNSLGGVHFAEGSIIQALLVTRRAADLCEALVADVSSERYSPDLAMFLTNLGAMHAALGRFDQGLPVIQRSVEIREGLAQVNPDRYNSDLAESLHNLGAVYFAEGMFDQALPVTRRAVDLYEALATVNPDRHVRDLASSLRGLAAVMKGLGRPSEAAKLRTQAGEIDP